MGIWPPTAKLAVSPFITIRVGRARARAICSFSRSWNVAFTATLLPTYWTPPTMVPPSISDSAPWIWSEVTRTASGP